MSNDLQFVVGDERWKQLREKALTNLFWFGHTVLGFSERFPLELETHILPLRFTERKTGVVEIDECPFQMLLMPRETGKSSLITIAHSIQLACRNPDTAILIVNEKQLLAQDFLKAIKHQFETNELLRSLFPEVIPPDFNKTEWSATRATLQRTSGRPEPTFDTIGVGGSITGRHFDHIVADDLISKEAVENARAGSWSVMESANFWVTTLRPLLSLSAKPFPSITFVGTRWYPRDTYEFTEETFGHNEEKRTYRMQAKLPNGKTVSHEIYRRGDLAVMRIAGIENGDATFPKIWSLERCAAMRMEQPELFAAFVMNDPTNESVRIFQDSWLKGHNWENVDDTNITYRLDDGSRRFVATSNLHKILVVDPAFTSGADSDRSAIVVLGSDYDTGKRLILEAKAQKIEPRDLVFDIIEMARRWRVSVIYIEAVAQQAGFIQFVQSELQAKNVRIALETVKPGARNKDLRIESISSYFKDGKLYVNYAQNDLLEEYRKFRPGTKYYRDLLDALAYAVEKAPRIATQSGHYSDARQSKQQELDSYYRRRGVPSTGPRDTSVFGGDSGW